MMFKKKEPKYVYGQDDLETYDFDIDIPKTENIIEEDDG